jgi:hypothetical protein
MTKGRIRCESDGDLYLRLAAGARFGNLPATLESRRALARLHAREGSLDATIAITKHIRAVAAEHQESDHVRPVEQDIKLALLAVGAIALLTSLVVAWRDGTLNPQADGDAKKTTRKNFLLGFGVALGLWLAVLIARSVSLDWMIGNGHWIATVLLFLCIFVVAVANARRVQKEESEKRSGGRRVQKEESEGQSGVAPSAKQESLEAAGELFARNRVTIGGMSGLPV